MSVKKSVLAAWTLIKFCKAIVRYKKGLIQVQALKECHACADHF